MSEKRIGQIELIAAITTHLDKKCRVKNVLHRQFNAIIKAANDIIAEMEKPYRPATAGMGLTAWRVCDDTGQSSLCMAGVLSGCGVGPVAWPIDPSDFGRCVGLLDAEPLFRERIGLMAKCGPEWNALATEWSELESLYLEELPSGKCTKLFARMNQLLTTKGPNE